MSLFFLSLYFLLSHLTPCECTISWSSLVLDVMTSDGLGRGWVSRLCPLPSPSIQSDTTSPPPLAPSLPPPHSSHPSPYFLPLHLIKLTMWCYLHADFADPHLSSAAAASTRSLSLSAFSLCLCVSRPLLNSLTNKRGRIRVM